MSLIDIVNFNADASCMFSNKWLRSLEGGKDSRFCKLLDNYIFNDRKVNIGLTGVTIKDLAAFNPETIEIIISLIKCRHGKICNKLKPNFMLI